ncbi:MAG: hypothetical protein K9J12_03835 [Melioribacteraceae bacterium]|nr:hypothetical protein [Melioribacteraceae bacterium]MCF8263230.1 hypothetical protein [Melioribacteraceae bacterium]MCF8412204.1 hypothetical protein [Melioribacteraceae bacterium]MCF8431018.1 hypothetical protein [Melioribacteraceae bacterium]
MKNFSKIFLISWYIFLTMGFSIATHFCGGIVNDVKLISVVDSSEPENCCGENSTCCLTEIETIKLTDVHQTQQINLKQSLVSYTLLSILSDNTISNSNKNLIFKTTSDLPSPPDSIFRLNCAYLI